MRAVIMAGGEGSRLRPLTCDTPKPMTRLCGRPILEYILELLERNGITEAVISTGYLSERIEEHFEGCHFGEVALTFAPEKTPLGTAGCVKHASTEQDGELLVLSGDAMCDFDLVRAVKLHRERKADVTLLVKKVADPREYGLVRFDKDHRVTGFLEKPAFSQAVSEYANTGVYILSAKALAMIPKGEKYDFAKDLFPRMLKEGMRLYCVEDAGYWCDIGDLESFISCQRDMLLGKVRCDIHGQRDAYGNIWKDGIPKGEYNIFPPCYVGKNVTLGSGSVVGELSVIDDNCTIAPGAKVRKSVLLPDCFVSESAVLTGSLVCAGGQIGERCMLFESSTVGAHCQIGRGTVVNPGIKIWPQKTVAEGCVVSEHLRFQDRARGYFDEEGVTGELGAALTPEFSAKLGAALGSLGPAAVAVGCTEGSAAKALKQALVSGLCVSGVKVFDFGALPRTEYQYGLCLCETALGVYLDGTRYGCIAVNEEGGLPATRETERELEGILARDEFKRCAPEDCTVPVPVRGIEAFYEAALTKIVPEGLEGVSLRLECEDETLLRFSKQLLTRFGCRLLKSSGTRFVLSADGRRLCALSKSGPRAVELAISQPRLLAVCCRNEFRLGRDVAVRYDSPWILDTMAAQYGRKVYRYFACGAGHTDREARRIAKHQLWERDGIMLLVKILAQMKQERRELHELLAELPAFEMEGRELQVRQNPVQIISALRCQAGQDGLDDGGISEGIVLHTKRGDVLLKPLKKGTAMRILVQAASAETAVELCDFAERQVRRQEGTLDTTQNRV